jgi:hypothetical protein
MLKQSRKVLCLASLVIATSATAEEMQLTIHEKAIPLHALSATTLASTDQECTDKKSVAADAHSNVFERAKAAREYRQCIETLVAVAVAQGQKTESFSDMMAIQTVTAAIVNEAKADEAEKAAAANFMDLSWGLGFGFSFGLEQAIDEAEVVDGVIRVTKDRTDQPRALFEFHRYFWCNKRETLTDRGCGPFLAVAATQDKVLAGVGVGMMFGLRSKNPTDKEGFSVGVGGILDGDVKSLADGFKKNEPLPPGETTIRFEEKARWSGILFVTRSF